MADQPFLKLSVMLTVGLALVGVLVYEDRRLARGESTQTQFGRSGLWLIIIVGFGVVLWNLVGALVVTVV